LVQRYLYCMPTAFVLINCELGEEEKIIKQLRNVDEIEVTRIAGVYDIIVKVSANNIDKLKEIITNNIRRIEKVKSTLTLIVSNS